MMANLRTLIHFSSAIFLLFLLYAKMQHHFGIYVHHSRLVLLLMGGDMTAVNNHSGCLDSPSFLLIPGSIYKQFVALSALSDFIIGLYVAPFLLLS